MNETAPTISRAEACEWSLGLWEEIRDCGSNEQAWAICERYRARAREEFEQDSSAEGGEAA